jgi:NADH-quinone oxidoreductase subunit N
VQEFNLLASLPAIAPEIGLTILMVVVLALDVFLPESQRRSIAFVTAFGMLGTAAAAFLLWAPSPATEGLYWGGMVRHDMLALIFKIIVLVGGALTALQALDVPFLARRGEFYVILIVSTLGGCLIAGASDLIMLFLGLETLTIPLYILATFKRDDAKSSEAGMKYFLFGSFASAILLYGLTLLYGFTGQTNLYLIAEYLQSPAFGQNLIPVLLAIGIILVGFAFKISAAPFHFWTPDVYEGAPTPVTAFLSVASKAASFALLLRFGLAVFPPTLFLDGQQVSSYWTNIAVVLAVASMTVGNLLALAQKNIKRLLAYSSIAQAGYILIGVAALQSPAAQEAAVAAVVFYLAMYTFSNMLAFGVVILFANATGSENIADMAGMSRRSPWLAIGMTVALLSLAGVPPAAGFFGKFFLFQAAVQADLVWLALVGVLWSIVALYYYLVVIKVMFVDHGADEDKPIFVQRATVWTLAVTAVMVILLGSFAVQPLYQWAVQGAASLFGAA